LGNCRIYKKQARSPFKWTTKLKVGFSYSKRIL
jgi:hypothetical protein